MKVEKIGRDILFEGEKDQWAKFDLKTKQMYRKTPKKDWYQVDNANWFFQDEYLESLKFKDEQFKKFIYKLKNIFGVSSYDHMSRYSNVSSLFTIAFPHYEYLQQYVNEGLNFQAGWEVTYSSYGGGSEYKGITKPLSFYNKVIVNFFKKHGTDRNGLEFTSNFEKRYEGNEKMYITLCQHLMLKDIKNLKRIECFFDRYYYDSERVLSLVTSYGYNVIQLTDYLLAQKELRMVLLKDYNAMMKLKLRLTSYKKYPEDLKAAHDLASKNYNAIKDVLKEEDWKEKVLDHINLKDFEYKDKEYCIVYPKQAKDIAAEGCAQNNCVKSYIDGVIERRREIVFMRKVGSEDTSLITIELKEENNYKFTEHTVVSAKMNYRIAHREARGRRKLTEPELAFLDKYSTYLKKKKGL